MAAYGCALRVVNHRLFAVVELGAADQYRDAVFIGGSLGEFLVGAWRGDFECAAAGGGV